MFIAWGFFESWSGFSITEGSKNYGFFEKYSGFSITESQKCPDFSKSVRGFPLQKTKNVRITKKKHWDFHYEQHKDVIIAKNLHWVFHYGGVKNVRIGFQKNIFRGDFSGKKKNFGKKCPVSELPVFEFFYFEGAFWPSAIFWAIGVENNFSW